MCICRKLDAWLFFIIRLQTETSNHSCGLSRVGSCRADLWRSRYHTNRYEFQINFRLLCTLATYSCSIAAPRTNFYWSIYLYPQYFVFLLSIVLGMGHKVEHFQRSLKYGAILGGSEEIMADLGIYICIRSFICVNQNQNDICSEFVRY